MGQDEFDDIKPDFADETEDPDNDSPDGGGKEVDLTAGSFPPVTKRFEAEPHNFLADPNYYKTTLANEGDIGKRVHGLLQKYFAATDPKDRSVFRPQIISSYCEV